MARVKKIQEDKPADWQTVFCSLAIILVAFFVMLCSYSTPEKGKIIEVRRSFTGAMDIFSGGILFDKGEGIVVPSPDSTGLMADKIAAPIARLLEGAGLRNKISLKSTTDSVSLMLLETVLFEPGTDSIIPEARPLLEKLAGILAAGDAPIEIAGHTDDSQPRADSYQSNWELSSMRAVRIMQFLHRSAGIPYRRMCATGHAQYRPFVRNQSGADRARNNRVEIIVPLVQGYSGQHENLLRDAPPSFRVW